MLRRWAPFAIARYTPAISGAPSSTMTASKGLRMSSTIADTSSDRAWKAPSRRVWESPCSSRATSLNSREITSPCWWRENQPNERLCRRWNISVRIWRTTELLTLADRNARRRLARRDTTKAAPRAPRTRRTSENLPLGMAPSSSRRKANGNTTVKASPRSA